MVQFSAFFADFAPWREIPGRPIESRKGAKLAKLASGSLEDRGLTPALAVQSMALPSINHNHAGSVGNFFDIGHHDSFTGLDAAVQ